MAKKSTGCVFDLEVTLANTTPDIAIALNKSLNDVVLRQVPLEYVIGVIGNGIPLMVRRALLLLKLYSADTYLKRRKKCHQKMSLVLGKV